MKVKGADEAKRCIAKRKVFRWNGWRGHKSKTAAGTYGLFFRKGTHPGKHYKVTLLLAVYEPRTATWYATEQHVAEIRPFHTDLPPDATQIRWINAAWLLQDIYRDGYPELAKARIHGLI